MALSHETGELLKLLLEAALGLARIPLIAEVVRLERA
jgi:hypothetical protein